MLASDGRSNLKGRAKLAAIRNLCRERGWEGFAYLGDSAADLPVWQGADERLVVAASAGVLRRVARLGATSRVFDDPLPTLGPLIAALRPQHWLKNGLLLLPILLAHQLTDPDRLTAVAAAVVAFSLAASAVYVINDALDVQSDRHHPDKRSRPFASGRLPLTAAPGIAGGLLAVAFGLSVVWLPWAFTAVLAAYLVTTSLYSLLLKRLPIVDVITLAGLYALRVLAGGTATGVPVSQWLMVFSIFLFTSLAFCKRYSELLRVAGTGDTGPRGRGYEVVDIGLVESVGPTSGLMAVLVLALYISSEQVQVLYHRVDTLWALIPLLLFWIIRLWFLARRGERLEDPVVFAATDPVSLAVAAVAGSLLVLAS